MGKFVVKYYRWIIGAAVILMVPALMGMLGTRVNYDMLNYLPDEMETVIGQDELLEDFHKGAFSMIITEGLTNADEGRLETQLREVEHVDTVLSLGTLENAGLPPEMLPDEVYENFKKGDESLMAVFFDTSTSADETMEAITEVREILDGRGYVSGMSALVTDLRNLAESEEPIYVLIAVALALVVMLVFLDNWLAPFLFLISIGAMILINLGTNFLFGEISYITKALSAVLQLAVTMDYSIFLWHSWREYLARDKERSADKAMEKAIRATLSSVFGSSATTIAGFIALCFMSFTLGLDLGLVMAKGVLFGVVGSVTVLPALILMCHKVIEKFDHKSLLPDFGWLGRLVTKIAPVILVLFAAIIPPALIGYQKTNENVYYTIGDSLPSDLEFAVANRKLEEDFGLENVHMVLTRSELESEKAEAMTEELKEIKGVKSVLSLESLAGDAPTEMLPEELIEILKSDKWELGLIVSEYHTASDEMAGQIEEINRIIKSYDEEALLVGEASCTKDMIDLTAVDFQVVNAVSIVAIFVIIMIVTGSLTLPVILIMVIETAIFVNLGLPYYLGDKLSFITPICISTIQLGATVDYAILMTTRYKRERLDGADKKQAAKKAIETSAPSVLVSGLGLFAATFGVAMYSNVDMIGSMCMLMARGAIISIVAVLTFLPALLISLDFVIIRTTKNMRILTKKEKA